MLSKKTCIKFVSCRIKIMNCLGSNHYIHLRCYFVTFEINFTFDIVQVVTVILLFFSDFTTERIKNVASDKIG